MTMMSTPSPQLSREEELALWLEQKRRKSNSRTPNFGAERRDSIASATSYDARSGSLGSASNRRRSNFSFASNEPPSTYKTPFGERQQAGSGLSRRESPLSAHVSCRRRQRIPRGDLSTVSSRLKQKSLAEEERKSLSVLRPSSWSVTGRYLENRPSSVRTKEWNEQENRGSLVNRIRSRAAMKKERDADDMSKTDSTPYRTPLTSRNSNAQDYGNFSAEPNYPEEEPDKMLDRSVSLTFEDVLSPLSNASQVPSPASTISSFEVDEHDAHSIAAERSLEQMSDMPSEDTMEHEGGHQAGTSDQEGTCHVKQHVHPLPLPASMLSCQQDATTCTHVAVTCEPLQNTMSPNSGMTTARPESREMELDRCDVTSKKEKMESAGERESLEDGRERDAENVAGAALDFQGIDDDDVDWKADETMASRLRRRRDSSFLLIRRPVPLDDRNSTSPHPAKSAFVAIERSTSSESPEDSPSRAGLQACAMFASPLESSSRGSHSEYSEAASRSQDSPEASTSLKGSPIPSTADQDNQSATKHCVSQPVLKVNDRSILERIPESKDSPDLIEEVKALRIANINHEKKLYAMTKAYEARITPFRDLFEDANKLRFENQVLKQEKMHTKKMIEDVKGQMIQCLQSAVTKNQELQRQLIAETSQKQKLEQELKACRKQLDAEIAYKQKLEQELKACRKQLDAEIAYKQKLEQE